MVKVVSLKKGQSISKNEIKTSLDYARQTFQYARFNFYNGLYIYIAYNKDQSIEVSSNSRNITLWQQIQSLKRVYTQARIIDFLYRWLNSKDLNN